MIYSSSVNIFVFCGNKLSPGSGKNIKENADSKDLIYREDNQVMNVQYREII